jgi:hypothetical protein
MKNVWIDANEHEVGDVGFLIETQNLNRPQQEPQYHIQNNPGRKNLSGEASLDEWLGNTNNIYRAAHGIGKIVRVTKNGRALVAILNEAETERALEELGYPDLIPA